MATDVKVYAISQETGKFYRAVRGEPGSKVWAWVEVEESEVAKPPDHAAGDIVFEFNGGGFMVSLDPAFPP